MAITLIKHSGVFVGRTDAYYNDDDEGVFTPEYWAEGSDKDSDDFAKEGPVFELNDEGRELLNDFREARNMNGYQRERASKHMRDLAYTSWNGMWDELTNEKMIVAKETPADAIHVTVWSPDANYWESTDDGQRYTFDDERYQVAYENACDCIYYGEGKGVWQHGDLNEEEQILIWDMAFEALADDYRY